MRKLLLAFFGFIITFSILWDYYLSGKTVPKNYRKYFLQNSVKENPDLLRITFLGTSSLYLRDKDNAILIDGFFSRPPIWKFVFGKVFPDEIQIQKVLEKAKIDRADLVISLHSHFDHAMDSAYIAKKLQSVLAGTKSTANIGLGEGLPEDKIWRVNSFEEKTFGKFKIKILPSKHVTLKGKIGEMLKGEIESPLIPPAKMSDYKEGGTIAVFIEHPDGKILIHGSAGFLEDQKLEYSPDIAFVGTGGLGGMSEEYCKNYYNVVIKNRRIKTIIPVHWDNFFAPLSKPLQTGARLMDNFQKSADCLIQETGQEKIEILFMDAFDSIYLDKSLIIK